MNDSAPLIELELTAIANGGSALGRHQGRAVFVPYTIPGERVSVRIVEERGRVAFGEGVTLLDASADRVYPACPHFGPRGCGRCQWQHISYDAQLLLKQDVLADQLSRIGEFDDTAIQNALRPMIASTLEWGYLSHLTFTVTPDGLALPGAGRTLPAVISECHILHADLVDLLYQVQFEDDTSVQRVKLARGSDGALMLILSIVDIADVPEMELDFPASVNLLLPDRTPVNLIGDLWLTHDIGGKTFRTTAGSPIRPNTAMLAELLKMVTSGLALRGGESVLDLYGGVGLFSAAAAQHDAAPTLVEGYEAAAEDARHNLAEFDRASVVSQPAEQFLIETDHAFDGVIVDPGSEGLRIPVIDALVERKVPRLVYVSSDPATLARDAKRLVKQGYRLEAIQPIDLSPQTYYVDCVATLVFEHPISAAT